MKVHCFLLHRFSLLAVLLCNSMLFAQENSSFFDGYLWIKGSETEIKVNPTVPNLEALKLKKYLNFNPSVDFSKDSVSRKYKNLVSKSSSLFIVFKCNSKEENLLFSLERGSFKSRLSNQKIVCDKEVILNKGDSKTGILLSYLFNKNSLTGRKNGNLILEDLLTTDKESINQLAELIYIPRYVSNKERAIIESYLSLKYGISLNEGQSYYNSKGDIIWDVKQNEGFNFNITGIGKDEYIGLNQKQSKNSIEDGLCIGLNKIMKSNNENETFIRDKDFLLWGNNGKSIVLKKNNEGNQKNMNRVWKINPSAASVGKFITQIKIDKKLMPLESNFDSNDKEFIWLAIDSVSTSEFNYDKAKYIKATINNENEIVFDAIQFDSDFSYLFTIVKANENILNSILLNDLPIQQASDNSLASQIKVYPNPINANEIFTIQFNLKETSTVLIQIADVNGKVIKTKNLGSIKNYLYNESILVSGTYLIMISVNEKLETSKLIVK